ncbi:MAG: hypothetical protein WDN26_21245 [Chitinophagaceae bacterium]
MKHMHSGYFLLVLLFSMAANTLIAQPSPTTYPKIAGYVGIVHPLVSFSKEGTTVNFKDYYIAGLPTGINIWKSSKIGFSVEFVPYIRAEKGISKMNNFLFSPGCAGCFR